MERNALPSAVALAGDHRLRGSERQLVDRMLAACGYPDEHAAAVAELAILIAERLRLDSRHMRALVLGALLHDVGKLRIDERILAKPGPLDEEEWRDVQRHPHEGELLLDGVLTREVLAIVRSHHERWDGHGYPDALAETEIPLGARIVAVADAYRAMLEQRPYRDAVPPREALIEVEREAGGQFDPDCVAALLQVVAVTGAAA
jgi:HD-GYP domain-containing protein (c-di-GMP phosphodiesterase class II)